MKSNRTRRTANRGAVLIISMIFVLLFSTLAVSLCCMAGSNAQIAGNQRKVNTALYAAQSGLECAKHIASTVDLGSTMYNTVSDDDADTAWEDFCSQVPALDGQAFSAPTPFADPCNGEQIITGPISFGPANVSFRLRFYRYDDDPRTVNFQSIGNNNDITRKIGMEMQITKDASVLQYAIASRGRMWLTGDSTIHGDIYSSWDRYDISPFNMTSDTTIEGTVNTVLDLEGIEDEGAFQLETLDEDGYPIDANGDPLGTNYADRYYGSYDEIQGYHEGINYGAHDQSTMPGMDISDYYTDGYTSGLSTLSMTGTPTMTEYFPHAPSDQGGYSAPRPSGGSASFTRHVYDGDVISNKIVTPNTHALFRNCTFEGVLYIDCYKHSTSYKSYCNNVRFENCTFNGIVITDVPQPFNWRYNCLYFTGAANFNNQSSYQEATILAPHFNVNLGNTNPDLGDNNILTGAIVGGIVDVRGNAQINGTILSMYDTTIYSSGYVTNIGATLDDGGSETTEEGDVGAIEITPDSDQMLPSGISSPIVIKPDLKTYSEGV